MSPGAGATKKGPPMTKSKIRIAGHDEVDFEPDDVERTGVCPFALDPLRARLVEVGAEDRIRPARGSSGPASIPSGPRRPRRSDLRGAPRTTARLVPACRRHPGCVPRGHGISRRAPSSPRRGREGRSALPPGRRRVLDADAWMPGVRVLIVSCATSTEELGIGAVPATTGSVEPGHLWAAGLLAERRAGEVDPAPAASVEERGAKGPPSARSPARRCPGAGAGSCPGARALASRLCRERARDARRAPCRSQRRARGGR